MFSSKGSRPFNFSLKPSNPRRRPSRTLSPTLSAETADTLMSVLRSRRAPPNHLKNGIPSRRHKASVTAHSNAPTAAAVSGSSRQAPETILPKSRASCPRNLRPSRRRAAAIFGPVCFGLAREEEASPHPSAPPANRTRTSTLSEKVLRPRAVTKGRTSGHRSGTARIRTIVFPLFTIHLMDSQLGCFGNVVPYSAGSGRRRPK